MALVEQNFFGHKYLVEDPSLYPFAEYEFSDEMAEKAATWADIKPEEVVMDLGASWGGWTLPALAQGATVIAVEPGPAIETLQKSVAANGWQDRLIVANRLLWDDSDIPEEFRNSAVRNFGGSDGVPISTLDELSSNLTRLDRIKFDVEGAEYHILRGGLKTLRRFKPVLIIEDHTLPADSPESGYLFYAVNVGQEVISLLESEGYSCNKLKTGKGNGYIVAKPVPA